MSEGLGEGGAAPSYDAADLRARMAVCFTANELRELANALGAEGVGADRSAGETARLIVRHFEKHGALGTLVERLREAKPLVEWPEPLPPPEPEVSPFAPAPPLAPLEAQASGATGGELVATNESDASALGNALASAPSDVETDDHVIPRGSAIAGGPEDLDGPIIQDPHLPPSGEPWISGNDGVVRPGGQSSKPPPAARGIDPKILIAVAGLTLLAAVFAFAAGRATSRPSTPEASATAVPSGSPVLAASATGPAAAAARAFTRSLGDVARICEVPVVATPSSDILRAAFDQCGPRPLRPPQNLGASQQPTPLPSADPDPTPDRSRPVSMGSHDALPPGPTDTSCFKGCQKDHSGCKSKCGAEPTDASLYGEYQACLGKCLATASKCRLTCQ